MKNVYGGLALVFTLLASGSRMSAQPDAGGIRIIPVSARADMVSGGDVLVRISVPPSTPANQVRVSVNGQDAASTFRRDESTHTLMGLATGLKDGVNELTVSIGAHSAAGGARLAVTNHPVAGPIFSGPHEQPFICETESFKLAFGWDAGQGARRELFDQDARRLLLPLDRRRRPQALDDA